jgi:hypothetical protein
MTFNKKNINLFIKKLFPYNFLGLNRKIIGRFDENLDGTNFNDRRCMKSSYCKEKRKRR